MARLLFAAAAIALAAPASLAAARPGPADDALAIDILKEGGVPTAEGCGPSAEGEVVVCGDRGPSPYRIDPTVLQAMRQKERAANPPRPPERSVGVDPCSTGPNGCPGAGAVDFIRPALVIATAIARAVAGDDWREPFRTGPDDYEIYEDAKERRGP